MAAESFMSTYTACVGEYLMDFTAAFLLISSMSFSPSQLIELLVVLCNLFQFRYLFSRVKSALAHAEAKSGPVRRDTVPTHLSGIFFTILQLSVCSLVPLVYTIGIVGAGLRQPAWMDALALPKVVAGVRLEGFWENIVRVLACVGSILSGRITDSAFEHLSDQYHPIGVRTRTPFSLSGYAGLTYLAGISVVRNRGSFRQAHTLGFVTLSTRTSLLLVFD